MLDKITLDAIEPRLNQMQLVIEEIEELYNSFTNELKTIDSENLFGPQLDPKVGEHVMIMELLLEQHMTDAYQELRKCYLDYVEALKSEDDSDE